MQTTPQKPNIDFVTTIQTLNYPIFVVIEIKKTI
jgi:hypothetical protein